MNTKKKSPKTIAEEAKAALASLIRSAPKIVPRHKWQDLADAISESGGIMDASIWGFTVPLGDGYRKVEIEGGWTEEHYSFLRESLDQSEQAMAAKAVLDNAMRREGCQEPDTAFWLLCKKNGDDEDQWLPQKVEAEGFSAIIDEMQDALRAYREITPRRPLKIAVMDHPTFDGKTLRWGERTWRFRKQHGPIQKLLTALENSGWRAVNVAKPDQVILAPNEVRLDPDDVRDAAKYLRKKTMPYLTWYGGGTFTWSVPDRQSSSL